MTNCDKEVKQEDITRRIKLEFKNGTWTWRSPNNSNYYTITILEELKYALLSESDKVESMERNIIDGERPSICIAYNRDTKHFQLAISDMTEGIEVGFIQAFILLVSRETLGIKDKKSETLEQIRKLLSE